MSFLFAILTATVTAAVASTVDVYHRVAHPDVGATDFVPRGQITESGFIASSSFADLAEYAKDNRAFYQIALRSKRGDWEFSSVKYCHLSSSVNEDIILHASLADPDSPYALDYFVSPIPHDGSCSSPSTTGSSRGNMTISWQRPHMPPLPELRGQPQVPVAASRPGQAGGQVEQPEEEKNFLQKYWLYIVAVIIALTFSGGGPPPEDAEGGARRPA